MKKFVSIILALASVLSIAGASASAAACGKCGENLIWTLDNEGTLTISGEGKMTDFTEEEKPEWDQQKEEITAVVIEEGVTGISASAFEAYPALTSVSIPASVTEIGLRAFASCENLTAVTVDENNENYCTYYGVLFSKDKTKLICYPAGISDEYYSIPYTVTQVESFAFAGAKFKQVSIPEYTTVIGDSAFYGCDNLNYVSYRGSRISKSKIKIGDGNENLKNSSWDYSVNAVSIAKDAAEYTGSGIISAVVGVYEFFDTALSNILFLTTVPGVFLTAIVLIAPFGALVEWIEEIAAKF